MKYALFALLAILNFSASAEVYVAGGIVNSDIGTGYDIKAGKSLNDIIDFELSYTDYGTKKTNYSYTEGYEWYDEGYYEHERTITGQYKETGSAMGLWAVAHTNADTFNLYGKVGLVYGRSKINGVSDSGFGYGYGVGVSAKMTESVTTSLEYRIIEVDDFDPKAFILSIGYTF